MDAVDYKSIGLRIKNLRIQHNLSQEQLAERCNISTSFLGHIERGTRKMSLETLVTLSTVLDVSIDYLLADRPVSGEKAIAPLLEEASQRLSEVQYQRLENAIKALIHSADLL